MTALLVTRGVAEHDKERDIRRGKYKTFAKLMGLESMQRRVG